MAGFGDGFFFDDIIGDDDTDGWLCDVYDFDEIGHDIGYDINIDREEDEVEEEAELGENDLSLTHFPNITHPYAVVHHGRHLCKQTFCSIMEVSDMEGEGGESNGLLLRRVPLLVGMRCYASQHGWLLLGQQHSTRCFLLNPTSMEVLDLPPIEQGSFRNSDFCVLSAPPPNCVVLFVKHIFFYFCRPGDINWTTQRLGLRWEYGAAANDCRMVDSLVSCDGKVYVSFGRGKKVKILHPTRDPTGFTVQKIDIVKENRPLLHGFCGSKLLTNFYMVESLGDVYLVARIPWGGSGHNMDTFSIDVYKLKLSMPFNGLPCWQTVKHLGGLPGWLKVEHLGGDRLFFLGKSCSFSYPASRIEFKENYIFYFEPDDECLWSYNMEDQTISMHLPWPNIDHFKMQPYWIDGARIADVDIDAVEA